MSNMAAPENLFLQLNPETSQFLGLNYAVQIAKIIPHFYKIE